jgi:hypothetical protein
MMSEQQMTPAEHQAITNAQIDFNDPVIAWNFGTRELTDTEYDQLAAAHHADLDRVYAARDADEAYGRWAQADPAAAAQYEADFRAAEAQASADPWSAEPVSWPARPWLQPAATPEPEPEAG